MASSCLHYSQISLFFFSSLPSLCVIGDSFKASFNTSAIVTKIQLLLVLLCACKSSYSLFLLSFFSCRVMGDWYKAVIYTCAIVTKIQLLFLLLCACKGFHSLFFFLFLSLAVLFFLCPLILLFPKRYGLLIERHNMYALFSSPLFC
jgi:hypothetical protein